MSIALIHTHTETGSSRTSKMRNQLNSILRETVRSQKSADLHADFMNLGKPLHLNRLFIHDGLMEILEANNYKHIE